ncbi:MAG: hypothetical protein KJ600_04365 [Nanoarchaeota archaeon]|nr:hypothetical protein [Nanoarchaeota archaeon]MBU1103762.1 hypothetical protein [Nanoarchaeota archaeon]
MSLAKIASFTEEVLKDVSEQRRYAEEGNNIKGFFAARDRINQRFGEMRRTLASPPNQEAYLGLVNAMERLYSILLIQFTNAYFRGPGGQR